MWRPTIRYTPIHSEWDLHGCCSIVGAAVPLSGKGEGTMRRTCIGTAALGLVVACGLLSSMLVTPAAANVYATDLKFSAAAVNASTPGATVDLSFRLNEAADVDSRIDIYRADTNALVRTGSAGTETKGPHYLDMDLKDNTNVLVPKSIEYYFKVLAKATGYGGWTLISDDTANGAKYRSGRSVSVNTDPISPYFGTIYVLEGLAGTTGGRTTTKGVYALKSDFSDAFGQGNTAITGGVVWGLARAVHTGCRLGPRARSTSSTGPTPMAAYGLHRATSGSGRGLAGHSKSARHKQLQQRGLSV